MLKIVGMILLSSVLLPLNDYLTLPASLNGPLACVVMIFLDVLPMPPTVVALVWRVAQLLAPQLISRAPGDLTDPDRDKRDDSNH